MPLPESHLTVFGLAVVLERWHPWPLRLRGRRVTGSTLVLAAALLAAAAVLAAGEVDLRHPTRLVVSGPYRWSRHPMYAAWNVAYLGGALTVGTAWPLALAPAVVVWTAREVHREERVLAAAFGSEHARYRRTVRLPL